MMLPNLPTVRPVKADGFVGSGSRIPGWRCRGVLVSADQQKGGSPRSTVCLAVKAIVQDVGLPDWPCPGSVLVASCGDADRWAGDPSSATVPAAHIGGSLQ